MLSENNQNCKSLNPICENCLKLGRDCSGTTCQTWTGCVYRQEDKEKRIFRSYRNDLVRLAKTSNQLRFLAIQYVCSFPKIDPYKMAVSLAADGLEIVFDDSAISKAENAKAQRKFQNMLMGRA